MNEADKAEIASRYQERLRQHGASSAALATGTPERQEIRFGVLAGVAWIASRDAANSGTAQWLMLCAAPAFAAGPWIECVFQ